MQIFGISDLHLSFASDKPMDVFGEHWRDHATRMATAWDELVGPDDAVLVPGDISWALRLEQAAADLAWIAARPGRVKVLVRGNHDYWWSAIGKVRKALPPTLVALQNDAIDLGEVVVAGSRLWSCPGALDFGADDQKIFQREIERLRLSLQAGRALAGARPLVAAIHYPPFAADRGRTGTAFSELLEQFGVALCVYGHLHGAPAHRTAFEGVRGGVHYRLIACDHLRFRPARLWPLADAPSSL